MEIDFGKLLLRICVNPMLGRVETVLVKAGRSDDLYAAVSAELHQLLCHAVTTNWLCVYNCAAASRTIV